VVKVFAKPTVLNGAFKVNVGCGQDPDINGNRPTPPYSLDVLFLKETQQICLQLQWQIANFVEQQGSPICGLDASNLTLMGSRKSTLLMPEQFGLDQVFGYCTAVDGHKGATRATRLAMQSAGNHFLAGAAFSTDHYGRIRRSETSDQSARFGHRAALSQQIIPGASLHLRFAAQA